MIIAKLLVFSDLLFLSFSIYICICYTDDSIYQYAFVIFVVSHVQFKRDLLWLFVVFIETISCQGVPFTCQIKIGVHVCV